METGVQGRRRWGLARSVAAGLTFGGAITAVVVLFLPAPASGRSACLGFGNRVSIKKFDPHVAKAGSNTEVTVWGSHLGEVNAVAVGPKGRQTWVMFTYTDNTIVFTVPFGAFSGPIEVVTCVSTAWSHSSLRV